MYWLLVTLVVGLYLFVWISHFQYIYGWIMDDLDFSYIKGMLTVHNWRGAFAFYNAYHAYYFLILYLPLMLPVSLPSYPIPPLADDTGHFRFLLLYSVFLHAVIVLVWAFFARLIAPATAALVSVVLFVTSPTLTLWTPQPESRLWGLPFILVGLTLLLRSSDPFDRLSLRHIAVLFGVGSLFGVAQSIHYTALYFILPFCVAFWGIWLISRWHVRSYWVGLASFVFGCVWLQVLLEAISYFALHIPLSDGPFATLMRLREIHTSVWSTLGNIKLWRDWFASQMGWPMIFAILVGWLCYVWVAWRTELIKQKTSLAIALTLPIALAYFASSGTMAFFRQTSMLQPFMFLVAAYGIEFFARRVTRREWHTTALVVALLGLVGATSWTQAYAVFEAHQGLGRALDWAHQHAGDRQLAWLRIAWFDDKTSITSPEELEQLPPDSWLISYYPWNIVQFHPSLQAYLDAATAVAEWPSLYSTDTMQAEEKGYGYNDSRSDPLFSKVRITRVGDIVGQMGGASLQVTAVTADSVSGDAEPVNVVDGDSSPDANTAWVSADTPDPHWLRIDFAKPSVVGALDVVLPPTDKSTNRIADMDIEVLDATGAFRTVWTGRELSGLPVIRTNWAPVSTTAIRLALHRQMQPWGPTNQAAVEELVFPGYGVDAPPPLRSFAPLVLDSLDLGGEGVEVTGSNITPSTSLRIGTLLLPTFSVTGGTRLVARIPPGIQGGQVQGSASLVDRFRGSNVLSAELRPPTLQKVDPAAVQVHAEDVIVSATTEHAVPGTVILFDSHPLETSFGNPQWLTAVLSAALIDRPGPHMISVRNALGESQPLELDVLSSHP